MPWCSAFQIPKDSELCKTTLQTLNNLIRSFPQYSHLADTATGFLQRNIPRPSREPFSTIIHFDLWTNNILHQIENGEIIRNVFVDFQIYDYRSAAADVFFFLWTSVQKSVLEQYLDDLIRYYHEKLLETLNILKVDTSLFGLTDFSEDLRLESAFEFGHSILFIFILKYGKEIGELPSKDEHGVDKLNDDLKEFVYFMVSECFKRGWLC